MYVGAFCSDFIPNDKQVYGSKQFEISGLHFEVLERGGPILGGSIFIMKSYT